MPRTGKGGKREGAAQTAYANRTDLNQRGPQPVTVAPGQAYGEGAAQREAQQAVPMGGTPMPPPSAAPAPPQPEAPMPKPGEIPWLSPTERPNEPISAGLSSGAGPGPESLSIPISQESKLADILEGPASSPMASPQVKALAAVARQLDL